MSISIEQPPSELTPQVAEYLNRILIQVQGSFENLEKDIEDLKKRINELENP